MSEENLPPSGGTIDGVRIKLVSAEDGVNIADASRLRLEIEGGADIVSAFFEMVLQFAQMMGGYVDRAMTDSGRDITDQFRPATVDMLDFGDDPVA